MSTTYSFACDDCKKTVWAGQSRYIYSDKSVILFLNKHIGHNLRFLNDLVEDDRAIEYEEDDGRS